MGDVFSLARVRVTVSSDKLEQIIGILNIPTKADQDRIRRDGILIIRAPSAPGGGPRPARTRSTRASTASRAASTASRAASTRSRTSRPQT